MSVPTFTDWFSAELDKAIANVPAAERQDWLSRQHQHWEYRRAQFYATAGRSEARRKHPTYGVPSATDFLLFITEIDKRRARLMVAA